MKELFVLLVMSHTGLIVSLIGAAVVVKVIHSYYKKKNKKFRRISGILPAEDNMTRKFS